MSTPRKPSALLLFLILSLLAAVGSAFAQDRPEEREPAPAPVPAPAPAPATEEEWTTREPLTGGLAPMRGDVRVPLKWLPPGAQDPDRGPSAAIYPPQKLTIRFNHNLHVKGQGLKCAGCHKAAVTSESASDALSPKPTTCDDCHGSDHVELSSVKPGGDAMGKCNWCHVGYKDGDGNRVAKFQIPTPNLVFNHKKHAVRNIACQQCHGDVEQLELATRDQLPRMRGCFNCHQHPDSPSRGDAKSACETCHIKGGSDEGGRIKTVFASGTLAPPRWMHNAEHGPDFVQRHKFVAANDSQFCASCHKEESCAACHDGRVRPRNIHPGDYLNMHAVEARLATQKCTSCHQQQSFCVGCHQRTGVSMSGPAGVRENGRFHPPKQEWSDPPRKPGHHAFEAMRNLNACVSCHIERDCAVCHASRGAGGGGFNPHSGGFVAGCATQLKRNPRPCYVCHEPGARAFERCR